MQRGEVFRIRAPRSVVGHEQAGPRYCVVVQSDALSALSTVIVAPTSTRTLPASFRPEIAVDGKATRVLADQLRAVDPQRLGRSRGLVGFETMEEIDEALLRVLGLDL
jgi:mRNA interferase MazF